MATFGTGSDFLTARANQLMRRKSWPLRGFRPLPAGVLMMARNHDTGEPLRPFSTQADGMWEVDYPGVDRIDIGVHGSATWTGPVEPLA